MTNLPLWQCHKLVRAALIVDLEWMYSRDVVVLYFGDGIEPIEVKDRYDQSGMPLYEIGGYFVQYENGYQSWSPASVFQSGYTLIEDDNTQS